MEAETFESVWDALARDPAEAANLKARSDLMTAIQARVRSWGVTQEAAAARLGIGRTRLNDLLRDKMHKFSLDALADPAVRAGLALEIRIADAA